MMNLEDHAHESTDDDQDSVNHALDDWALPNVGELDVQGDGNFKQEKGRKWEGMEHQNKERLSKRLMYLLRYGAVQEGLKVHPGGFVDLISLQKVPLMLHNTEEEVWNIINESMTYRGTPRFETKRTCGVMYVRARYGLRMERSKCHEGTMVPRLLNACLNQICSHVTDYDFENFPDLFLLNAILHQLKRNKKLSNNAMKAILHPRVDHLDLEGAYITQGTLKILGERCPYLQVLSLRSCGYALTDTFMGQLFKKIKNLHSLNISGCYHLTDKTLIALAKSNADLIHLNASGNQHYSEKGLLNVILTCSKLEHLDVFDNQNVTNTGRETMIEISKERNLTVILKGLTEKSIAPEDPSMVLKIWKAGLI